MGSGFAAQFQYDALTRVNTAQVEAVGVYSPTTEHREAFARQRGIRSYESLDRLMEEADVIHVCTPPKTHEDVAVAALGQNKHVVIEKPLTGYFGDNTEAFDGDRFSRDVGYRRAMKSVTNILKAEAHSDGMVLYAENWVYIPAIQKEREIVEKTGAQILWMHGEESHSGSHSPYYGIWAHSGGGSLMGKGVHPVSAALYLKKVEGRSRNGRPIRPVSVSARVHAITRSPKFRDQGYLRTSYQDIEDFAHVHITFEDDTFADLFASELVLGGTHNWLEVVGNNHRTRCNINPNNAMETYNPREEQFEDIYVVEKIGTKQGWSFTSPDEAWFHGYQHELDAFYGDIIAGRSPESDSGLAADTINVVYAGYLSAARDGAAVPLEAY